METESFRKEEEKEVIVESKRSVRIWDLFLRFMAFALSLAAALALGLDKQTATVPITLVPTLPPINVPVTASWNQMPAFKYFMVINILACSYGGISMLMLVVGGGKRNGLAMLIIIADIIMVALVASGCGAAAAVGAIGYDGNKHTHWGKVCDKFGKYCHQLTGSVILSLFAAATFLLVVVLSALHLHKKSY